MAVFLEVTRQHSVCQFAHRAKTPDHQEGPGTHPIIMSLIFIDGNFPEYNILTPWTQNETMTQFTLVFFFFFIKSTKVTHKNLTNYTFLCHFFFAVSPRLLFLPLLLLLSPLLPFLSSLPALLAALLMLLQSGRIHRLCHLSAA